MPNPEEVATLVVGGRIFDDWLTVMVQDRMFEPFPIFRFTAAERDPLPEHWGTLQFAPPDPCAIYLGGKRAIAGIILTRQVAYDANQHAVQLQGVGRTYTAANGAIEHKTGNFDNKTFDQVSDEVVKPFGYQIESVGQRDQTPYKKLQLQPGETLWDFLERIARPRGIIMGNNDKGNLLRIGEHESPVVQELTEGYDIKRCQCIISMEHHKSRYVVAGQTAGSDDMKMKQASEQEGVVDGTFPFYMPLKLSAEQPVWNLAELLTRANHERTWNEGQKIECNITVYGWLRRDGQLWHAGDEVVVNSPMCMLGPNTRLKIEEVTFTQSSDGGTETTLKLRDPSFLKGKYNWDVARKNFRQVQMPLPEDWQQQRTQAAQEELDRAMFGTPDGPPQAQASGPAETPDPNAPNARPGVPGDWPDNLGEIPAVVAMRAIRSSQNPTAEY